MMEEVSADVAYDTDHTEQVSQEEIQPCLLADTGPAAKVPPKRAKLKDGQDLSKEGGDEDPIDKYQRENQQLLQTSLRLEQENDNLAHRLVTSKIALRNSLDEAEDTVDDLMEQLQLVKRLLKTTEEELRAKEQEAEQLKEAFRRDLETADQGVKRSSRIVVNYKQICSQLTLRLEVQQATQKEEMEAFKSVMRACPGCRHVVEPRAGEKEGGEGEEEGEESGGGGGGVATATALGPVPGADRTSAEQYVFLSRQAERQREEQRSQREKEALELQIRGLERELAQTKLQMVEANCSIQELEHQNGILSSELQDAKNSWFIKTFTPRRASSGGIQGLAIPRDEGPLAGWPVAAWRAKRPSWLPKEDSPGEV